MIHGTKSARLSKALAAPATVIIGTAFDLHMSVGINVLISIPYVI
jgi:hypothetical protein